jgi:hypothetical protein
MRAVVLFNLQAYDPDDTIIYPLGSFTSASTQPAC